MTGRDQGAQRDMWTCGNNSSGRLSWRDQVFDGSMFRHMWASRATQKQTHWQTWGAGGPLFFGARSQWQGQARRKAGKTTVMQSLTLRRPPYGPQNRAGGGRKTTQPPPKKKPNHLAGTTGALAMQTPARNSTTPLLDVEDCTLASPRPQISLSGGTPATRWHSRAPSRSP